MNTKSKVIGHSKYLTKKEDDSGEKKESKFSGKMDDQKNCRFQPQINPISNALIEQRKMDGRNSTAYREEK